jgi:Trk K+ transport system NAD-binding subunit
MSKVIIYGYSNLGSKIAKSLKNSEFEIIIVDYDEDNYNKAILDDSNLFI